ncbi:MAG: hypothetical protein RL468_1529 [Pseudomonadota bacterium]
MPELHSISFIWPRLLWLQLALPLLALAYFGWLWHSGPTCAASAASPQQVCGWAVVAC